MSNYAKGRNALAECQRSGKKMRYRDLVEDGHVPGLLVSPDWWEPKHPQEIPITVTDPVALYRPAPEISIPAGYGNPENLDGGVTPTGPLSSDFCTTAAATVVAGATQVVLDVATKYTIGQWVFITLDGGGSFVSRITTTADSPSFVVPFTTPFIGTATAGNQVCVGTGYSIQTTTFTGTLGQFSGTTDNIGWQEPGSVGSATPAPALLTADDGLITAVVEIADYPAGFAGKPDGGLEIFLATGQAGTDNFALLSFDTYSSIEIDHAGGTLVLNTANVLSGGDLDYTSYNVAGGGSWWFPDVTKVWFDADIGQTYQMRWIP
jgi:hypothetical protein